MQVARCQKAKSEDRILRDIEDHSLEETPIQRVGCLGSSFNNAKSQLRGVPFELSDLSVEVLGFVDFGSLVHIFHRVAEHAVDQSRQLSGHRFDCNGRAELGSESAKLITLRNARVVRRWRISKRSVRAIRSFDSGGARTISGLDARLRLWQRYTPVYDSLIL